MLLSLSLIGHQLELDGISTSELCERGFDM
jgi:hypothetical protein